MNHTLCPIAGGSHKVCDWWPQLLHGQSKESGTGTSVTVTWVCKREALVSTLNNAVYVDTYYSQLCSICWMCVVLNLVSFCLSILLSTCIKNVKFVHGTMVRKVKWKQKAVALQQCKVQSWYENDSVSAWTASLEYAHGFTAKKKKNAPLALSMYFLCCFNSCVWLEKCWLCFLRQFQVWAVLYLE